MAIYYLTSTSEYGVLGLILKWSACHVVGSPSSGHVYGFACHGISTRMLFYIANTYTVETHGVPVMPL